MAAAEEATETTTVTTIHRHLTALARRRDPRTQPTVLDLVKRGGLVSGLELRPVRPRAMRWVIMATGRIIMHRLKLGLRTGLVVAVVVDLQEVAVLGAAIVRLRRAVVGMKVRALVGRGGDDGTFGLSALRYRLHAHWVLSQRH